MEATRDRLARRFRRRVPLLGFLGAAVSLLAFALTGSRWAAVPGVATLLVLALVEAAARRVESMPTRMLLALDRTLGRFPW